MAALYVAFYGGHRVFQEHFAEMAIGMRRPRRPAIAVGREPQGWRVRCSNGPCSEFPAPKRAPPRKMTQTLVRAGFVRSGALRIFV